LVVGPTGSGKTTTLHSVLGHINRPEVKIWTAEDPVEITQYGLRQVQTHSKIGYTFAEAMRSFLRADPDIIMVGEMRDAETAAIGLEASLTGHLVLSTLHTNSAPETVTRLIDMGMNPLNFADALLGILAQRLVQTICPECKEGYHPERQEFDLLAQEYGEDLFEELNFQYKDDLRLYRGRGCPNCNDSGYRGRAGIHELLVASEEIKELIQNRAHMEEIRRAAVNQGMRTLKQDGILKVFQGLTDFSQVRRVCIV
jgi:type II secretory ATPase GspE/PulE/Tfp pilus assembly ATPase PilB-like protein